MASTPLVRSIRTVVVHVTTRTNWVFVVVETDDDRRGVGEATLDGHEPQVLAEVEAAARGMIGRAGDPGVARAPPAPRRVRGDGPQRRRRARSSRRSGTSSGSGSASRCRCCSAGRPKGASGCTPTSTGRSCGGRTPEAFAAAALDAVVAAGFDAVKVAPFDGLRWEPEQDRGARALIDAGLARIGAVRDAVGPAVDVLIDCHGRFNPRTATVAVREMERIDPYWIEAPVSERDLEGWRQVRDSTSARLAGGEFLVGLEAHRRFIAATGVDVVMPDVKYCGGISGLVQVAAVAESFGVAVAPHDPSGPVSTAATAQAALAAPTPQLVEFAWGETTWRGELVGGETIDGGLVRRSTAVPGSASSSTRRFAAGHPFEPTPVVARPLGALSARYFPRPRSSAAEDRAQAGHVGVGQRSLPDRRGVLGEVGRIERAGQDGRHRRVARDVSVARGLDRRDAVVDQPAQRVAVGEHSCHAWIELAAGLELGDERLERLTRGERPAHRGHDHDADAGLRRSRQDVALGVLVEDVVADHHDVGERRRRGPARASRGGGRHRRTTRSRRWPGSGPPRARGRARAGCVATTAS